jgi:hypothetical protein
MAVMAVAGCGPATGNQTPAVTPSVTLARADAAVGGPVQLTYRFVVEPGGDVPDDYRVFVHFVDVDRELLWTDDHNPPVPTRDWRPGAPIEYTRDVFVPKLPFVGETSVEVGLFSPNTGDRVPMAGDDQGQRSYQVATFNLRLPTDTVAVAFKDGWHRAEAAAERVGLEWQWSKQAGTLAFRNPKRSATFFLQADQPVEAVGAQQVEVRLGATVVDTFTVQGGGEVLRKVRLSPDQFGPADAVEMTVAVDRTFVPAVMPQIRSTDTRELGIRVFWAFIQPD